MAARTPESFDSAPPDRNYDRLARFLEALEDLAAAVLHHPYKIRVDLWDDGTHTIVASHRYGTSAREVIQYDEERRVFVARYVVDPEGDARVLLERVVG